MEETYFTASDGLKIDLVPGWYEQKHTWPFGIKDFSKFAKVCFSDPPYYHPTSYAFLVNKVVTFNYLREILNETMIRREKWPHR